MLIEWRRAQGATWANVNVSCIMVSATPLQRGQCFVASLPPLPLFSTSLAVSSVVAGGNEGLLNTVATFPIHDHGRTDKKLVAVSVRPCTPAARENATSYRRTETHLSPRPHTSAAPSGGAYITRHGSVGRARRRGCCDTGSAGTW